MKRALAVVVFACAAVVVTRAEIVEQVIVKVNGDIFTKTDLEQRQISALRVRNNNRAITELDLQNDAQLKEALAQITPQLVVDAIDEMLIMQQGKERGYHLGDEQFKGIVERIRKENKLEDDERFQAALKQEGITIADLRKSMERQMVVSRVQNDAVGRIQVTEEEARQYYAAHPNEFTSPASLTLREILIEVKGQEKGQPLFNVASDESSQIEAQAIRARALAGEDFAKLAAEYSAAASKANGGLIGPLTRDEIAPALQKIIDPLTPGQITEVIRAARGYQFFKLESSTPPAVKPFEQAREDIVNKIYNDRRAAEFKKYLQKLRAQAIIEWKNDELRKLYEQALASEPVTAS